MSDELIPVLVRQVKRLKKDVDFLAGRVPHAEWKDVQDIVRAGLASRVFQVGDQFEANFNGSPVLWDIIGIDHDTPTDPQYKHSLTLQSHNVLVNAQWDAPEALYYAETELAAGEHIFTFTISSVAYKYKFTTSSPVSVGGQIAIDSWTDVNNYVPSAVTTYEADRTTAIESGLPVTVAESGDDTLTPINHHSRCVSGSNRYIHSNIHKWLNSTDSTFTWSPANIYDMPSTGSPYSGAGFLALLDEDLVTVLGSVDKQVVKNSVVDGGGQDLFSAKVFLLSRVEDWGGPEAGSVTNGEKPYDYYKAMSSEPVNNSELAGRSKQYSGSAVRWWLRSPNISSTVNTPAVHTNGAHTPYAVRSSYGVAPAIVIV